MVVGNQFFLGLIFHIFFPKLCCEILRGVRKFVKG